MLATYLFWALLWLPGLAAVRRWAPAELERGALSVIALGYAASFALLSPCSLACYVFRWPAWVFSSCAGLAVVAGAVALIRGGAWRALRRPDAIDAVGGAVLGLQLVLAARIGGWLDGDATYHLGRVRDLLDHGYSNRDFYLALDFWSPSYAFNLVHALHAAAVQLTRQDMLIVWFASLPCAQLLVAAGHYHLAQVVFGHRAAGWIAAVAISVLRAPETYALYPNVLAVGWLAPLLLAHACDAQSDAAKHRFDALVLASLAFVTAQVHLLYWGYVLLAGGPALGLRLVLALATRRTAHARALAICLAGLLAGVPLALSIEFHPEPPADQVRAAELGTLVPYLPRRRASPAQPRSQADQRADTPALAAGGGHLEKQLDRFGSRWVMPVQRSGGALFIALGIVSIALCALRIPTRRGPILALAAGALTLLAIPLVPVLCTLAVELLPTFTVARMVTLAATLLLAAQAGALAVSLERLRVGAVALPVATLVVAVVASRALGHAPRSYAEHIAQAAAPLEERAALLNQHRAWRALLRAHLRPGETVLASLRDGRYAVMLHDLRVVAVDRGHGRTPRLGRRRDHVTRMTDASTPWQVRSVLLQHYRLGWVIYRDKYAKRFKWATAHGRVVGRSGGLQLARLALASEQSPAAAR